MANPFYQLKLCPEAANRLWAEPSQAKIVSFSQPVAEAADRRNSEGRQEVGVDLGIDEREAGRGEREQEDLESGSEHSQMKSRNLDGRKLKCSSYFVLDASLYSFLLKITIDFETKLLWSVIKTSYDDQSSYSWDTAWATFE